jgi:uncharacterized membrane protein/uncharacterized RDD family membrane protein YckC
MVDGITITLDVVETSVYFVAPGLLWLFVFLLAYSDDELARGSGFGRITFWLLLPAALLGEFANVLIFGLRSDLLAVNVGGGLVPVLLAVWLLLQVAPGGRRAVTSILVAMAVGSVGALLAYLWLSGPLLYVVVAASTAIPAVALYVASPRFRLDGSEVAPVAASIVGLFAATVLLTALTTSTIPGVGIVSAFPEYLIVPTAIGAATPLLLRRRFGESLAPCLAIAYASVTLGVLVGADVLHQPPLYANGPGALYAIGGAGLLDLLYLSGQLSLLGSYGAVRYLQRNAGVRRREAPGPSSPMRRMRHAWYLGLEGEFQASLQEAQRGSVEAVATLRRLAGLRPADPSNPWEGIGAPPWVALDQTNLDAVARRPGTPGREAYRGWLTARALVGVAHFLGSRYRASSRARCNAFAFDLAVLALLTAAGDLLVLYPLRQSLDQLVNGIPLNAIVVAPVGWGLLYFVIMEGWFGATLGKWYFGLTVTSRLGTPAGFRSILIRNLPRIVPLSLVAYGLAFGTAVALHPRGGPFTSGFGGAAAYELALSAGIMAGMALTTLVSVACIATTEEGQRIGDLLADTWVLTEPAARPVPAPAVPAAAEVAARPGASPPVVG